MTREARRARIKRTAKARRRFIDIVTYSQGARAGHHIRQNLGGCFPTDIDDPPVDAKPRGLL
jgi:hypothetical protein